MGRVIHFEIHAEDPARAASFYGEVFGWQIQKWAGPQDYWLITTGPDDMPGINGAILKRAGSAGDGSPTGYVCTIDVDDLDTTLARALGAGASLAMPRDAVPGIGWLAYARDTEGNVFGMMQADVNARPGGAG
jgi:predicted enzyme related to lactoylglutathione lyase